MKSNTSSTATELVLIPDTQLIDLYRNDGLRPLVEKIKTEARSVVTDPTTEKGRKEIASLAYKVARSKTKIDEMGKSLTEDARGLINRVNEERRFVRDEMDALRDEVRKPLTDYENREKARVAEHERQIAEIAKIADGIEDMNSAALQVQLDTLKSLPVVESRWQEFAGRAEETRRLAIQRVETELTRVKEAEDQKAELERLRKEKEEREKKEHEERIAREAAEKARREAEEAAVKERARVEAEREAAERKAEAERRANEERIRKIEQEKKEAEERHSRELRQAEQRAREEHERRETARLAQEQAEREAAERKAADKAHRVKINHAVAKALEESIEELSETSARSLTVLIGSGKIPHLKIQY